jgi:hypothetical protein
MASTTRAKKVMALAVASAIGLFCSASGCGDKEEGLPEAECGSLRSQAYKLINGGPGHAGHGCQTDADCHETTWPECRRAVNTRYRDEVAALEKKFNDGKCKDTSPACKDSPPVWCNQGLCANKEPGEKMP